MRCTKCEAALCDYNLNAEFDEEDDELVEVCLHCEQCGYSRYAFVPAEYFESPDD